MLKELYNENYRCAIAADATTCFGDIAIREKDTPAVETRLLSLLAEYRELRVNAELNITFPEYANTDTYVRSIYRTHLQPLAEARCQATAAADPDTVELFEELNKHAR